MQSYTHSYVQSPLCYRRAFDTFSRSPTPYLYYTRTFLRMHVCKLSLQAQCLLNLSGDAVLLEREQNVCQEPVDASGSSPDQAFSEQNLLHIPEPSHQSESTVVAHVVSPSTAEVHLKKETKSVSSKLPKALQRKKHSETEI